jgi:hypothetical protein
LKKGDYIKLSFQAEDLDEDEINMTFNSDISQASTILEIYSNFKLVITGPIQNRQIIIDNVN